MKGSRCSLGLALGALVLATAPPALGAADPLNDGTTTLQLSASLQNRLQSKNVALSVGSGAQSPQPGTITLPVDSGKLDPTNGAGTIGHRGVIKLKHGKRKVTLSGLTAKLSGSAGTLSARVAGKSTTLFTLSGESSTRDGFFADLSASAKLAAAGAKKLNKLLATNAFVPGASAGTLASQPIARTVTIVSGTVDLTPSSDPSGFPAKLAANGVTPSPVSPATFSSGAFHFPVTGGKISLSGLIGQVELDGGLELTKSMACTTTQTALINDQSGLVTSALADIEPTANGCPGNLGRVLVATLERSNATVTDDFGARTVTIDGETQAINAAAAALLNALYSPSNDFAAGDVVGTLKMTLQAQ